MEPLPFPLSSRAADSLRRVGTKLVPSAILMSQFARSAFGLKRADVANRRAIVPVKRAISHLPVLTARGCTLIASTFAFPSSVARLHQPWTFVGRWILGTTNGAAVIPDTYRLQAGDADDTTSFDNHTMFHEASLERPLGSGNALFGEGTIFHQREMRSLRCGLLVPSQAASPRESWEVTVTASGRIRLQ
jgi:hypothetical protein